MGRSEARDWVELAAPPRCELMQAISRPVLQHNWDCIFGFSKDISIIPWILSCLFSKMAQCFHNGNAKVFLCPQYWCLFPKYPNTFYKDFHHSRVEDNSCGLLLLKLMQKLINLNLTRYSVHLWFRIQLTNHPIITLNVCRDKA